MEGISVPQAVTKDWKRCLLHHMQRQQCKTSRNMKRQGKMTPPKNHNDLPVSDPQNMEIYNMPDKEFKIAVLRKPNKHSESPEGQFNEIRKTIHEQNEKFNKEKEIIKKKKSNRNLGAEECNE